uniref:CSON015346 protein n=1 Tax=Culicoides sonorensis TaxID=179676 RepID=A0A336MD33_CULSO
MEIQVFGGPCGSHGSYTFYKALKLTPPPSVNNLQKVQSRNTRKCVENSRKQIRGCRRELVLALGDCVPVRPWEDSPIACLAEIRMIWRDKNEQSLLTSLRLYFLPENTPSGRNVHGEDEVIALNEQIVLRADDLMQWVVDDLDWNWGLAAVYIPTDETNDSPQKLKITHLQSTRLEFNDVDVEKSKNKDLVSKVSVISYSRYCRYRATLKRLESVEDEWVRSTLVETITGFVANSPNMKIMFCRDTFEYPELETHENLCNHLAPKLKGRPRSKRRLRRSESPYKNESSDIDSEADESDASACSVEKSRPRLQIRPHLRHTQRVARRETKSDSSELSSPELKSSVSYEQKLKNTISEEKSFLARLNNFMVKNPNLYPKSVWMEIGQVNLFKMYMTVQKLGGYDAIVDLQTWRLVVDDASVDDGANIKNKYEKVLLPFERYDTEMGNNSKFRLQNFERRLSPSLEIIPIKKEDYNGKELTKEQMMKIQNLVKDKRESDDRMSSVSVPLTTTITVQCNDQQIMNQIKITNQIQIQQIRVNSEDSPLRCNIKQDKSSSDMSEENGSNKMGSCVQTKTLSLRNVRKSAVTTPPNGQREKENIPLFLGCKSTTITPIAASVGSSTINLNSTPKEQIIVTPEIVDLADNSDSESSLRGMKRSCSSSSSGGPDSPSLAKKKKLDMLKAGGLEVTPISSNSAASALWQKDLFKAAGSMNPEEFLRTLQNLNSKLEITPSSTTLQQQYKASTKTSKVPPPPKNRPVFTAAALPKLQPVGMYAQTGRVYGDPKEILPPDYQKSVNNNMIDLTASLQQQQQQQYSRTKINSSSCNNNGFNNNKNNSSNNNSNKTKTIPVSQVINDKRLPPSLIPAINLAQQKMKNNAGLQISLVQPPNTTSTHVQNIHNSQNHNIKRKDVSIQPISGASSSSSSSRAYTDKNNEKSMNKQQQQQNNRDHSMAHFPPTGIPNLALANLFSNPLLFAQYMQQAAVASSNSSNNGNKQNSNSMPQHVLPSSFNHLLNTSQMGRTNQPNPFLSMMDPLYLSALYSNPRMLMQNTMTPELLQQLMKNLPPKDTPISKS